MAKKEDIKKPLKKGQSQFVLIGEAKVNDFTYKMNETSQKSDWVWNQLNLGVDCGDGNVIYSELMGGYGAERDNVLYVHGNKENENKKTVDDFDNQFTIAWEDRFDEDILATIGEQCFITIGLEKDKKGVVFSKKFLSAYDAIEYIQEHLESEMVLNVKGGFKYSMYNDSTSMKKEIKSIFLSKKESKDFKAVFTQTVLIDKDSVGKLDKEKAVYPISVRIVDYIKEYNGKLVKQNITYGKTFELEVDKEHPEKTKKFIEKVLRVKKDITEITLEGDIVEGQTLVNITEADLPDDIKDLIDCGAYSMEDAINKLAVGGSKEKRMIIRRPAIKMVGENEEDKKPLILKTESKYKDEDLVFDFMFEEEEDTNDDIPFETDDSENNEQEDEDSTPDWMKALDEE